MIVIKLGGSLYGSPYLQQWLDKIVACAQPIIIVPGGGPFADQVRDAQKQHPINDADAHHMALLAMAQFGLLLCGLHPKLTPYYFIGNEIKSTDKNLLWVPSKDLLSEKEIDQNWDVSADSLALWLAQQYKADKLLIIKNTELPESVLTTEQASSLTLIDAAFPSHYQQHPIPTTLIHASQVNALPSFLSGEHHSGLQLL